jgi:hypothetical protein
LKIRAGWLLFGVLAYLGWLLATLPMALLVQQAREAGVPLQLQGESGSLWRGAARQLVLPGVTLGGLRWDFAPASLLRGRLGWDLAFRDEEGAAIARLAIGVGQRVELRDLSGRLAARRIAPLLPMNPGLAGDLVFDAVHLELRQGRPVAARGQLRWLEAALTAPMPFAIGSAELELQTPEAGEGIAGQYRAEGPALELQGQLLTSGEGYHTESLLTPRQKDLVDWLQALGQPRVGNAFRFVYEGNW